MTVLRSLSAEFLKLRYAPIIWLCVFVVGMVTVVVFASNYLDVNSVVKMGANLWPRQLTAGHAIFSVFMVIPFVVMFVSTAVFVENNASGWKYLYATPRRRTSIFLGKLLVILLVMVLIMIIMQLAIVACTYLLDYLLPELEFRYYDSQAFSYASEYMHTFIALLGVIGIQYFLSLRFKGFLIPMSFGIVSFLAGFIIGTLNKPMALYSPYSYVSIVKDFNMFRIDEVGVTHDHWLSNVEVYSIICFLVFVGIANVLESRKVIST